MLELKGIDYAYPGGITALADVNLAIEPGQKVAILGANGAGKTTLLSILNGSLRPDRGAVQLDGRRLQHDKPGLRDLRQKVGMVLQDPDDQLFAATVFEDVSFGPANLGLADAEVRARVDAALDALRISDLRDRPTHMLSFGQRKRVAIAGIVAMQPRFLLLDEPTAGLDPLGVTHLLAALRRISADGTAIVLTTHDMDIAYAWAERIIIFGEGRIACDGPPESVFADRELLKRLHLRPPIVWEIGLALQRRGICQPMPRMPRSRQELLDMIQGEPGSSELGLEKTA